MRIRDNPDAVLFNIILTSNAVSLSRAHGNFLG
jgi:hypothetical protein